MTQVNPEFVERYQLEYQKNPKSKVFAPLAEAYRKMGLLDEAYRICKLGVSLHPEFAGGRVALAKVLLDRKKPQEALTQLENAVNLSPDNLLAHMLMGETLLELRRPKDALKAFKMVLFLNPSDERAKSAVRKWEFLTAEEYDDEAFSMRPLFRGKEEPAQASERVKRTLERALSLADAFTVRNDLLAAIEVLENAQRQLGPLPDIENRLRLLNKRTQPMIESDDDETEDEDSGMERRRLRLEKLLRRIDERRIGS